MNPVNFSYKQAYSTLIDPEKRKKYDMDKEMERLRGFTKGDRGSSIFEEMMRNIFAFDPDAESEGEGREGGRGWEHGRGRGREGERARGRGGERKPAAKVIELEVTLEELYTGREKRFPMERIKVCKGCRGTKQQPPLQADICPKCRGRGRVQTAREIIPGLLQRAWALCPFCSGDGFFFSSPSPHSVSCPSCAAAGFVSEQVSLKVNVLPGMKNGQRMVWFFYFYFYSFSLLLPHCF